MVFFSNMPEFLITMPHIHLTKLKQCIYLESPDFHTPKITSDQGHPPDLSQFTSNILPAFLLEHGVAKM